MSLYRGTSLRTQMIFVLIIGLLLSHVIGYLLYLNDRRDVISTNEAYDVAERAAGVIALLRNLPDDWRADILTASDSRAFRVWASTDPALASPALSSDEENAIDYFRTLSPRLAEQEIHLSITDALPAGVRPPPRFGATDLAQDGSPGAAFDSAARIVTITVRHPDGYWLNFLGAVPAGRAVWPSFLAGYILSVVFGVAVIAFWLFRRVAQPLSDFAGAAERLGKDIQTEPLEEEGPAEVAQAARAFNLMQQRLARLVRNRTEFLAAVSHDLRTPITQLKLRSELVEDAYERDKFLAALQEMDEIIATFLDYARSAYGAEERSRIDLGSLVESVCSDMADAGADVTFDADGVIQLECKRLAIKRGARNLIENAVAYAGGARVSVFGDGGQIVIRVDDDGPGLAGTDVDDLMMPFNRGDPSRNRRTGGVGLGLSIAQAVAHDHGGRLDLRNRVEGGLRAEITLPR